MNRPMKLALGIVALSALGACDQPQGEEPAAAESMPSIPASEAPPVSPPSHPQQRTAAPIADDEGDFVHMSEGEAPKPSLCWQDYCPCDNPVTALDRTICRNARAGIEMSDDQWSIGAEARDLKYAGDESNRQMDEVIADMKAGSSR